MSTSGIFLIFTLPFVLFLIDAYVLSSWMRFVRTMKWNNWLYRIPWIISLTLVILSPFVSYQRSNVARLEEWVFILILVSTFWYVPKLPIALILGLNDAFHFTKSFFTLIVKGARKIWRSLAPKNQSTQHLQQETLLNSSKSTNIDTFDSNIVEEETDTVASRRTVLQAGAWGIASIPFILVGKGLAGVDNITVFREEVYLPKLSSAFDGMTIVQISDLHAGSWRDDSIFSEARRLIMNERPSIVCITGDFVNYQADELKIIRKELESISAELGVFASLGNHDHYSKKNDHDLLQSMIINSGIKLLINDNHTITIDGEKLQIVGTDNTGYYQNQAYQNFADLPTALLGLEREYPTVLLAHDPTFWEHTVLNKSNIDITLCGHTHGGQVGMNIFGETYSIAQILYKHWAGLYREGEQYLYVNRGLGTVGPPLRIGIPPEITVLTLRKMKNMLG